MKQTGIKFVYIVYCLICDTSACCVTCLYWPLNANHNSPPISMCLDLGLQYS